MNDSSTADLMHIFVVPFLSGLSSSKTGSGYGDGVDSSTVAVINEICERAQQSDVSAAIAAARAVSGNSLKSALLVVCSEIVMGFPHLFSCQPSLSSVCLPVSLH
jgi:hypothetical protein